MYLSPMDIFIISVFIFAVSRLKLEDE